MSRFARARQARAGEQGGPGGGAPAPLSGDPAACIRVDAGERRRCRAGPEDAARRPEDAARGMELAHSLAPSPLTILTDRAAKRNNEYGGSPRPSAQHAQQAGLGPEAS